uniref:Mannosidase beta like n=1 Tax=Nomascus leucogenys TaxID=61853 RepID=A0A2I3GBE1_NOMLE
MASDLDFSPPEVPEPTFLENLLWYGLFLGAIFQLICGLAIIISIPKSHEVEHVETHIVNFCSKNHHRNIPGKPKEFKTL